jgi:hypothetical protein
MGRPTGSPAHPLPGGALTWASALGGRSMGLGLLGRASSPAGGRPLERGQIARSSDRQAARLGPIVHIAGAGSPGANRPGRSIRSIPERRQEPMLLRDSQVQSAYKRATRRQAYGLGFDLIFPSHRSLFVCSLLL